MLEVKGIMLLALALNLVFLVFILRRLAQAARQ